MNVQCLGVKLHTQRVNVQFFYLKEQFCTLPSDFQP